MLLLVWLTASISASQGMEIPDVRTCHSDRVEAYVCRRKRNQGLGRRGFVCLLLAGLLFLAAI